MITGSYYHEEKMRNAICFFASEHERQTGTLLTHASLYQYLAFLDYASMEKTGHPALGVLYHSRGRRPLTVRVWAKLHKVRRDCATFLRRGQAGYLVKATGKPDLSFFSSFEASEMKRLVETYGHRFAKASRTGEASSRATGLRGRMPFARTNASVDDVLDHNIFINHEEVRTMAGLHALIEKYVAQIKELETRMADVKHKLEVVMEASRLLIEEGITDE